MNRPVMKNWDEADRLADRLIDEINAAVLRIRASPEPDILQLLAGWLLSFKAMEATMPPYGQPPTLVQLRQAVDACLVALRHEQRR